jgi:hypothetical protein
MNNIITTLLAVLDHDDMVAVLCLDRRVCENDLLGAQLMK